MLLNHATPEQQIKIRENFNENPKTSRRDLELIKEWLLKEPHLPNAWVNEDQRLMSFLRVCKFSLEVCKRKLDMYFTVRTAFPEFFSNRDIRRPELQEIFKIAYGAVLPDLTPEGQRVAIARAVRKDFETPNFADVIKVLFMVGDLRLEFEKVGVLSDVYIFDLGFPIAKHFLKINPMVFKKMFICIQEAYPVRISAVHFINAPPFLEFVMKTIQPFLNEELRNSFKVHTKIETLYDFVPREMLPEDYGGNGKKMAEYTSQWMKTLEDYTSWFQGQEDVKTDESKRPGKAYCHPDVFGVEGSFRNLNVD